jgi:hypothetical protein
MGTITVRIYERVKHAKKWSTVPVEIPKLKKDGTLFLRGDRQRKYRISWYENRRKQWHSVKSRVSEKELPYLSDAIRQAEDKAWFLNNRQRNVTDPTVGTTARKKLADEIPLYINAKSGCKKTVSAHRWRSRSSKLGQHNKKGGGPFYVVAPQTGADFGNKGDIGGQGVGIIGWKGGSLGLRKPQQR